MRETFWHEGCFLHLDGIKEFERATMTRIGRCQIKTHNLLAMLPHGETISPRSKFSRPNCVDQYQCANVAWLPCRTGKITVHTLTPPDPQAFFEIA
jgi:hypothetical protein